MQRAGIFAIVTFLLFGHINSAVITRSEPITTAAPEETTQDAPAATPEPHNCHDHDLKVDSSNPVMGDVPISRSEPVEIINRNRKSLQNSTTSTLPYALSFLYRCSSS